MRDQEHRRSTLCTMTKTRSWRSICCI